MDTLPHRFTVNRRFPNASAYSLLGTFTEEDHGAGWRDYAHELAREESRSRSGGVRASRVEVWSENGGMLAVVAEYEDGQKV